MLLEFFGISIFSIILGNISNLKSQSSHEQIVEQKKDEITYFLFQIDRLIPNKKIENFVYDNAAEYIETTYEHGLVQSFKDSEFFDLLTPKLKNKLVFELLDSYYKKFYFFFNDIQEKVFADDVFIRKILSSMHCQIFFPSVKVVEIGKEVFSIYFIYKGTITVNAEGEEELTCLPSGSFFGDYQILFDLKSNYEFMSTVEDETWCMTVPKDEFIEICEEFPQFHAFLTQRALTRRNYFKLLD